MSRRLLPLSAALCLLFGGCVFNTHRIGLGPTGIGTEVDRQYYLFFGLVRLNEVDTQRMAGNLTSYEIDTRFGFTDLILLPVLLPFTVTTRTVTVDR